MKKILELKGIQKLSKEDQGEIRGSRWRVTCCPRGCLLGGRFCEPGYCDPWRGNCILY